MESPWILHRKRKIIVAGISTQLYKFEQICSTKLFDSFHSNVSFRDNHLSFTKESFSLKFSFSEAALTNALSSEVQMPSLCKSDDKFGIFRYVKAFNLKDLSLADLSAMRFEKSNKCPYIRDQSGN